MEIRNMMTTIDTHTEGEPTRIITGIHQFILDKNDPLLNVS